MKARYVIGGLTAMAGGLVGVCGAVAAVRYGSPHGMQLALVGAGVWSCGVLAAAICAIAEVVK